MLKNLQKIKNQNGFTIIEVLIVLAIAGLIMVVVFLAVPALQRSGRNNALNSSANNILTAVGNFASDNGGTLPATSSDVSLASSKLTIGASGTNQQTISVDKGVASVVVNASPHITTGSAIGSVEIVTGTSAVCNGTNTGLNGTGSARSYVVLYVTEGGNGNQALKCIGN
jgi:prepilin-type N-terminal cleavage/methylation domain-containing protein